MIKKALVILSILLMPLFAVPAAYASAWSNDNLIIDTNKPIPVKVNLSVDAVNIKPGMTLQEKMIATYTDGHTEDVTSKTNWTITSNEPGVIASVSPDGLITGVKPGEAYLYYFYQGYGMVPVGINVEPTRNKTTGPAVGINIGCPDLHVGQYYQLDPHFEDTDGHGGSTMEDITPKTKVEDYTVQNGNIGIDKSKPGLVYGKTVGTDKITLTWNGRTISTAQIHILPVTSGTIKGFLKMKNGDPVRNVRLELHSNPIYTTTDQNGFFEFDNVPLDVHTLYLADPSISKNLIQLKSVTVKAGDNELQLPGSQVLSGLKDGGTVQVAQVSLSQVKPDQEIDLVLDINSGSTASVPIHYSSLPDWFLWLIVALLLIKLSVSIASFLRLNAHSRKSI